MANNSRIVEYLCSAAENNKEVTVLIELKARFDEKNNIEWAERLEEANCNVIYGFEGFKVHTKICLVTRRDGDYWHLLVAPNAFKNEILSLIDDEIEKAAKGKECGIIIKSNSLTDKDVMNKLSEASCAGVEIKLIIRGICCILPGIIGKTENITVISIIGRFLEHSRIYLFGKNEVKQDSQLKTYSWLIFIGICTPQQCKVHRQR